MNNKLRDELDAIVDANINKTNYIDMSLEDIKSVLVRQGFGEAESNVLSAAVKYMVAMRHYEKPTLTPVQKERVCEYWSHVKSLDTLAGAWGDMTIMQMYRKFQNFRLYNRSYIDYILHSNPDLVYESVSTASASYSARYNVKRVHVQKLIDILYNDYLEIQKEM